MKTIIRRGANKSIHDDKGEGSTKKTTRSKCPVAIWTTKCYSFSITKLRRKRKCQPQHHMRPNHAVQLTPLARLVGWARFTRQNAPACWHLDNPQPSGAHANPMLPPFHGAAARALPGSCLCSASSTLPTPASGAADSCPLGGI